MPGIDQNTRLGPHLKHGAPCFKTVHAGHAKVKHQQVRLQGCRQRHSFAPVLGHAHNAQMPVRREQTAHALHKQLVIVHQQNTADLARNITHWHGFAALAADVSARFPCGGCWR